MGRRKKNQKILGGVLIIALVPFASFISLLINADNNMRPDPYGIIYGALFMLFVIALLLYYFVNIIIFTLPEKLRLRPRVLFATVFFLVSFSPIWLFQPPRAGPTWDDSRVCLGATRYGEWQKTRKAYSTWVREARHRGLTLKECEKLLDDYLKGAKADLSCNFEIYYKYFSLQHALGRAGQGELISQLNLGLMYFRGEGVPQDYFEGVPQDYVEAAKWFRVAAERHQPKGQYCLGLLYYAGDGVPQDYMEAYKWIGLAASQGLKEAIKGRYAVAAQMSPTQITEAKRVVHDWIEQHGK